MMSYPTDSKYLSLEDSGMHSEMKRFLEYSIAIVDNYAGTALSFINFRAVSVTNNFVTTVVNLLVFILVRNFHLKI